MPGLTTVLPIAAVALGILWIFTVGTMFGLLLVRGGARRERRPIDGPGDGPLSLL